MAAMNIARRPQPSRNRVAPRRPVSGNTIGAAQGNTLQRGHEFLTTFVVPVGSTLGQNLYQLEVNPTQFPQLAIFASQYTQWRGNVKLHLEALGNAFATSSISAAYIADPDPSDLPSTPADVIRVVESVEAASRLSLHLQDSATRTLLAPWRVTTNPRKFVVDTDLSDRANGLFLVSSMGDPGSTPINIKVSVTYDVAFFGRKYTPLESALATPLSALYGANNRISSGTWPTVGAFSWVYTPATFTLVFNYPTTFMTPKYYGTWAIPGQTLFTLAVPPSPSVAAILNRTTLVTLVVTATSSTYVFTAALAAAPVAGTTYTWSNQPRLPAA
jgi:hypothetical protein